MKKVFLLSLSFLFFILLIYFFISFKTDKKPLLKILTYSSFAGVYGPGPSIKIEFEKKCSCQIQWFLVEDSTALLQRFLFLPEIDIVIGWDQITKPLKTDNLWEDISYLKQWLAIKNLVFSSPFFIPLDWSPIGFIYKKSENKILSLKSLKNFKSKISFPEPRASVLGLQFYYWIYEVFDGDRLKVSQFLQDLKSKIYGPVFSWSLSYGFFKRGQSQMGLSYLSSLLYHQKEELDKNYFFAEFEEGHPYQIEFFSVSKASKNKKLALSFASFLLSSQAQKIILEKHYMLPVSKQITFNIKLKKPRLLSL